MLAGTLENLFLNGDFLPDLWSRSEDRECAVWRQTFAADRWMVRYAAPQGRPVIQARSHEVPPRIAGAYSLEIRGLPGVTESILLGQRIEAAEAPRYRRQLIFSGWLWLGKNSAPCYDIGLAVGTAPETDVFDNTSPPALTHRFANVPAGRWVFLEHEIDARAFSAKGLAVELEFPTTLWQTHNFLHVAGLRLADAAAAARTIERPASLERTLARRFFQRHDSTTINSLGRALVVNAHELHFQFTFPEMRPFPACTLPHDETQLRVFDLEGLPQSGFAYDVTYRSRGSIIVRATKPDHGLRDGFLSFVGREGAILLDAEL